METTETKW